MFCLFYPLYYSNKLCNLKQIYIANHNANHNACMPRLYFVVLKFTGLKNLETCKNLQTYLWHLRKCSSIVNEIRAEITKPPCRLPGDKSITCVSHNEIYFFFLHKNVTKYHKASRIVTFLHYATVSLSSLPVFLVQNVSTG